MATRDRSLLTRNGAKTKHRVSSSGLPTRNFLSTVPPSFGFHITTGYFFLNSSIMSRSAESSDIIVPREVLQRCSTKTISEIIPVFVGNGHFRIGEISLFFLFCAPQVRLPLAEIRHDNFKVVITFKK